MSKKTADAWVEEIIGDADLYQHVVEMSELDDTFAWGARLQYLCRPGNGDRPSGLLLVGPDGCGKHTAAAFAEKTLLKAGYACMFLAGAELNADGEPFSAVKEKLEALLEHFRSAQQHLCLLIEEPDRCACSAALYRFLGECCYLYAIDEESPDLFLILLSQNEPSLPALLREQLRLCRMNLPLEQQRRAFMQQKAWGLNGYADEDRLVELTAGFTYAQMLDALKNLELMIDANDLDYLPEEELAVFFASQDPPRSPERRQLEFMDRLEKTLQNLHLSSGAGPYAVPVSQKDEQTALLKNPSRKEIEKQPVATLLADLFHNDTERMKNIPILNNLQQELPA